MIEATGSSFRFAVLYELCDKLWQDGGEDEKRAVGEMFCGSLIISGVEIEHYGVLAVICIAWNALLATQEMSWLTSLRMRTHGHGLQRMKFNYRQ